MLFFFARFAPLIASGGIHEVKRHIVSKRHTEDYFFCLQKYTLADQVVFILLLLLQSIIFLL